MAIFTAVLPILLKLVGLILDWVGAKKETKKRWLEAIAAVENDLHISVGLNEQDRAAADDLREQWEQEQKKKNPMPPG